MLAVGKGLIWLFLATIAEVPPVVSVASPIYPPLLFIVTSSSQVFICLNLNSTCNSAQSVSEERGSALISPESPVPFDEVRLFVSPVKESDC